MLSRRTDTNERLSYFKQYSNTSLLNPASSPRDGIFNSSSHPDAHKGIGGQGLPTDPVEQKILIDAHKEQEYRAFVEHPALTKFIRNLMGWKEHRILDRTMLRHNVPLGKGTGIHYDKLFLRGGEGFFLTAWVPIGKASFTLCLRYLEKSCNLFLIQQATSQLTEVVSVTWRTPCL